IGLSGLITSANDGWSAVDSAPGARHVSGRPLARAPSSDGMLDLPRSQAPRRTRATIVEPLGSRSILASIPAFLKSPASSAYRNGVTSSLDDDAACSGISAGASAANAGTAGAASAALPSASNSARERRLDDLMGRCYQDARD